MHRRVVWLLPCLALIFGCGGGDEWSAARPKVYKAGGVVNLDGKPVEGAVVVYHSQAHQISAQGATDADGRFQLTTYNQHDGAAEGKHKVVVTKRIYKEVKTKYDSSTENAVAKIPTDVLPKKYAAPLSTDIEVDVSASGGNTATIELSSR